MASGSTQRAPRQLPTAQIRRVSLLDLELDQIEEIEVKLGLSVKQWDAAPSQGRLLKAVYAVVFPDVPADVVGRMTLRQLQAAVDLSGDSTRTNPSRRRRRVASISRRIGWTMQEVRRHQLRDLEAMLDVIDDEDRARRRQAAHRKARGK